MVSAVVVATAILRGGAVLAQQRAYPPADAGRWELPGGRVEPGESEPDAVRRECAEELGVRVVPAARIGPAVPLHDGLELRLWRARLAEPGAVPVAAEHLAARWVGRGGLHALDWLPGDRALLPYLTAALAAGEAGGDLSP